jgi:sucrose-6-phosphate hydrolase SacC (GH32 family)
MLFPTSQSLTALAEHTNVTWYGKSDQQWPRMTSPRGFKLAEQSLTQDPLQEIVDEHRSSHNIASILISQHEQSMVHMVRRSTGESQRAMRTRVLQTDATLRTHTSDRLSHCHCTKYARKTNRPITSSRNSVCESWWRERVSPGRKQTNTRNPLITCPTSSLVGVNVTACASHSAVISV